MTILTTRLSVPVCLFLLGCGSEVAVKPIPGRGAKVQPTSTGSESPSQANLADRLDNVIAFTRDRKLVWNDNAAWQVIHGVLAFGPELMVVNQGQTLSALDYVLGGTPLEGWRLSVGEKGIICAVEPGSKAGQGHKDQWLGYLSASNIPADHPVKVGDKNYQFIDLVTQAQWECKEGQEFGWTLSGLLPFISLDAKWTSQDGQEWTYERMMELEAKADLEGASCGGTHSLIGLANVLNRYLEAGGKLTGGWATANERIQYCVRKTKEHQQPDGSFSTGFFSRPATSPEISAVIHADGHTLEFLCWALTDAELAEPWVQRGVEHLCSLLETTKNVPVECGALYHAARGLQLYRDRRFGAAGEVADSAGNAANQPVESARLDREQQ